MSLSTCYQYVFPLSICSLTISKFCIIVEVMLRAVLIILSFIATPCWAIVHLRFQHWFKQYAPYLTNASHYCTQEIQNYYNDDNSIRNLASGTSAAIVTDCILRDVPAAMQANLTSAQVLLGIVPAVCGLIGPSIADVAVLSTYRPLLAMLLAIGSPAINIIKVFSRVKVAKPLKPSSSPLVISTMDWLARQNRYVQGGIEGLCYVGALAAIANNVRNSVFLDIMTLSGWSPGALFMPLAWSTLALLIHGVGMIAIRTRKHEAGDYWNAKGFLQSRAVFTLQGAKDTISSELLFFAESIFAVIHVVFGVFVLSSLVFIGAYEALQTALIYFASAALCHFILLFQLSETKAELSRAKQGEQNKEASQDDADEKAESIKVQPSKKANTM